MGKIVAEELVQRIAAEPSVLFLGQNYLSSMTGRNPFYDAINAKLFNNKLSSHVDFKKVWDNLNGGEPISEENIDSMLDILNNEVPTQPWLRKILSMRWGMIVTSAIDSAMLQCVGSDFSVRTIDLNQRAFNRRDISKNTINLSLLYGSIAIADHDNLLKECSDRSFRSVRKKVNDRIGWIYGNVLSEYGVMVIDGWNPESDWLSTLLDNAGEMPYESIYLFGANSNICSNDGIQYLIDEQILVPEEKTFAQFLADAEFFETVDSYEDNGDYTDVGRVITLTIDGQTIPTKVSFDAISKLDSHIQVLYDDLWIGPDTKSISLSQLYAQFQRQVEPPAWYLHNLKYGFYFERSFDGELRKIVERELKKPPYKRRHVIIEGDSNTGKTASLVNLAYVERSNTPVIYISGEPTQIEWMEDLKEFIKSQFVDRQSAGKWISSVLVIWDANTDYNAPQRCSRLQSVLRETNAVVVGSAYPLSWSDYEKATYRDNSGVYHIVAHANLDENEASRMLESIRNVNTDLCEKISRNGKKNHLLESIQQMVRLEYSPEWKAVAEALISNFNQEVTVNEEFADQKYEKYMTDMAELVDKEINKYGVASSWQLQLAQISKEFFNESVGIPEEKKVTLEKFQMMERRIKKLNRILALSGEFSVELPLTLVLRLLSDNDGKLYSDEKRFLFEIIGSDSLIRSNKSDTGETSVCFRHPVEAEMYVYNNFGQDKNIIEENEVKLLKEIINACVWGEDSEQIPVLQLVRSFGPNSWGTPKRPKDVRHFYEFRAWWKQIAETLIEAAPDEPEANLVYAFLIRSACRRYQVENQISLMSQAKDILREAIEKHSRINTYQYCRLLGEMCANLVYTMKIGSKDNESIFYQLKGYFASAVSNWSDNSSQNLFTRNDLLDIWLNGVENYFGTFPDGFDPMSDSKCAEIVADSINYIENLFDITEENFDDSSLLRKVDDIYHYVNDDVLDKYETKLEKSNNDSALFLRAWKCWKYDGVDEELRNSDNRYIKHIANNLYMFPEDYDRRDEYRTELEQLLVYARHASSEVISVLEAKQRLIDKSSSTRCLQMLIKAKWLYYTGNLPMKNKQTPCLTDEQWGEIDSLCQKYIQYADKRNEQLNMSIVMLRMIYTWCYTQNRNEFEQLRDRQGMLRGNEWYFEKICICNPGKDEPKQFIINLVKNHNSSKNEYIATIAESIDARNRGKMDLIEANIVGKSKKSIHVPARVKEILLNGRREQEIFKVEQPVVIWFNAKGPQIGILGTRGGRQ